MKLALFCNIYLTTIEMKQFYLGFCALFLLALNTSTNVYAQGAGTYQFSASSGTFTPINGTDTVSEIHADSKLSNTIPIGFTFEYEGISYTHLKASSNSFLQFDITQTSSRTTNDLDNVNEPIIAPFWDDNDGRATGGSYASYLVTGSVGSRVFTFEWLNWEWRYSSSSPTISCQVKLYETSNKIEFIYRPESGTVSSGTASIGLCGLGTGSGTFLSLNDFGTNPSVSNSTETTNISSKPASGQKYTFSPPTCLSPNSLRDSATAGTSTIIKFNTTATSNQYTGYYQVSGSSSPTPISGFTSGSENSFNITGLTSATSYEVFVRVICGPGDTSAYATHTFSTVYPNPQSVDFTGFTGSNLSTNFQGWSEANSWPTPTGSSSAWTISTSTQQTGLGKPSARINLYTNSRDEWLISPAIVAAATDSIRFEAAVTNWNSAGTDMMGADDSLKVLISTDNGSTWTTLMNLTAANSLTNSFQKFSISIAAYAGQAVRVAWYAQDGPVDNSEDYDFHVASLFIGTPPNLDMAGISAFTTNSCLSSSEPVWAVIENKTTSTMNFASNNTVVGVKVSGATSAFPSITLNSDTLGGGDTMHVKVGTVNMSASGTYSLNAFTSVSGDGNNSNDTAGTTVNYTQSPLGSKPQKVDFNGFNGSNLSTVFPGWSEASGLTSPSGTSSLWLVGNASQTSYFGKSTAKINLYTNNRDDWIISPKMSIVSGDSLFFKAAITGYNSTTTSNMGSDDSVKVLISTDCGTSWSPVMVFTSSNAPGNTMGEHKVSLAAYNGNDVYIAFYGQDGPVNDLEDYDFHITDIFIGTPPTNDAGVMAILNPVSGSCGSGTTEVKVVVRNNGVAPLSNVGITAKISGSATTTLNTTVGSIGVGVTDTVVVGTFNTLAGGTYNITAYNTQSGDQDNSNDTSSVTGINIGGIPSTPTVANKSICAGDNAYLVATGTNASNVRWFNTTKPDSAIFTGSAGDTLWLNGLTSTGSYSAEGFNTRSETFGPTTAPTGSYLSSNNGRGTGFNVNIAEVTIDSVTIYPTGTGWIILKVSDYAGTTIYHTADTVFITGTNNLTKTRIPVNLTVPYGVGIYKMVMEYSGITGMGRNSQSYPFNSSGNEMSIIGGATGTGNPTSSNNYWFYDWKITVPGCPSAKANAQVTVNPLPQVNLGPDTNFCASAVNYTMNATTTSGATYKWQNNSTNASFTATAAGTYYCEVTVNGCSSTDSVVIGSYSLPTVSYSNPSAVCSNVGSVSLSGGTPTGGSYSGSNVSGSSFNASAAGAGTHAITYTYTDANGCSAAANAQIVVNASPTASLSSFSNVCDNLGNVTLSGGTPAGGTYTGTNVSGTTFTPSSAGTSAIGYVVTNSNSCSDTAFQNITVLASPSVSFAALSDVCDNGGNVTLTGGMPTGGTYSGNNVSGTTYSPTSVTTDNIRYVYTSTNSCSDTAFQTITVHASPLASFASLSALCDNSSSITLSGGTPTGGTYGGNNVTGSSYTPSAAGTDTLSYVFTNSNSCSDTAYQTILVNASPTVAFTSIANVCDNSSNFILSGGTPAGGNYSGNNVSAGVYSISGAGTDTLKYIFTNTNACTDSATQTITVNASPIASFGSISDVCDNAGSVTISGGLPIGGQYSGNNVTGSTYTIGMAGTDTLTYVYTDTNMCSDTATQTITVFASPTVTLGSLAPLCENSATVTLTGGMPSGGTYTGNNVSVGTFDPSAAGVGSTTITYTFTDGNNCTDSASNSITVNAVTPATFNSIANTCDNANTIDLSAFVTPSGGVFSGGSVTGNNFDPKAAGAGTFPLTYVFTNSDNCTDVANSSVTVEAAPVFNVIGVNIEGCDNNPIKLTTSLAGMGTQYTFVWSDSTTSDSATYSTAGDVWVVVVDTTTMAKCSATDTITGLTFTEECVGVSENGIAKTVSYFPNPNNGSFTCTLKGFESEDIDISVLAANGQVVYNETWNNVSGTYNATISLEEVESGLYFVNLKTENGQVTHRISVAK